MAKLIGVDKSSQAKAPTFKEAQTFVGGYVETVSIPGGGVMLVNEDGLSLRLPFNLTASALAGRPIVGAAVLLETKAEVRKTLGG